MLILTTKGNNMNEVQEFILRRAMQKVASTFTPMNNTHEYNHSTNNSNSNKPTTVMHEQQHVTNEPQKGKDEAYAFGAPEMVPHEPTGGDKLRNPLIAGALGGMVGQLLKYVDMKKDLNTIKNKK